MRVIIGYIFIFTAILLLFSNAPFWDSVINFTLGYLLLKESD